MIKIKATLCRITSNKPSNYCRSFYLAQSSVRATTTTRFTSMIRTRQFSSSSCGENYKDVTSGTSVPHWLMYQQVEQYKKLKNDMTTDVVVVGGGIAGLSVAYTLVKEGRQVVLIEDGQLLSGETGRTTAHLMSAIDDKYCEIEKAHGLEYSKLMYDSHSAAIDYIESIVNKENIDCEFKRVAGYLFAGPDGDASILEEEYNAARRAGFHDVKMVDSVPGINVRGVMFPRQGQFDPVMYCRGLAKAIIENGGMIFTQSHVKEFQGGPNSKVVTSDGVTVLCNHIAICTNVPVNDRVTMYTKMEPYRSYAIAARVKRGTYPYQLWWDTAEPYHYVRLTPDHEDPQYDILISGGEDHKCGQVEKDDLATYESKFGNLEQWTRSLFPAMLNIETKWSGQVLEPMDMIAFIGRNPSDHDNVYICTGDSGTGMTHCTIAGILIRDLIVKDRENPWEHMYNPSRKPTSEKLSFIKGNLNANAQYKDYLVGGDVKDIEDILPGCGAVVKDGLLHKVAVYRDERGTVHKCSAVCPHLKAIVHWNDYEKSWDCPAHGSRFDPYGKVVMGPSNSDLPPCEHSSNL